MKPTFLLLTWLFLFPFERQGIAAGETPKCWGMVYSSDHLRDKSEHRVARINVLLVQASKGPEGKYEPKSAAISFYIEGQRQIANSEVLNFPIDNNTLRTGTAGLGSAAFVDNGKTLMVRIVNKLTLFTTSHEEFDAELGAKDNSFELSPTAANACLSVFDPTK